MAAYNWIVILLCMGFFGLLYGSTHDVVSYFHDEAYTETDEASRGVSIIWLAWRLAPAACLVSLIVYAYQSAQKQGGGL